MIRERRKKQSRAEERKRRKQEQPRGRDVLCEERGDTGLGIVKKMKQRSKMFPLQ